jgi:hypothetical protein
MTYNIDSMQVLYLALALVLPLTALAGSKLNWSKGLLMALIWGAIFVATAMAITAFGGV